LEEQHSGIDAEEEQSGDEDGEVKVEPVELALRSRAVTRSSLKDHSASLGGRSKRSWRGRISTTLGLRSEEKTEMDLDNLSSDSNIDGMSHQHGPQIEGARLNAERDMSQSNPDLSGEHDSSLAAFESDAIGSDAYESGDKDALIFDDDLDTSSEPDSSE